MIKTDIGRMNSPVDKTTTFCLSPNLTFCFHLDQWQRLIKMRYVSRYRPKETPDGATRFKIFDLLNNFFSHKYIFNLKVIYSTT